MNLLTRRQFGVSMAAVAAVSARALGQEPRATPIPARTVNLVAFFVSNVDRTVEWYQKVFGLPVQYRYDVAGGKAAVLAVGKGPQSVVLYPANGAKPGYSHWGFGIPGYNRARLTALLAEHQVKTELTSRKSPGGEVLKLIMRDPDNLKVQLQDASYCGGGGPLGNQCPQPWTMAPKTSVPPVAVTDWNHVSVRVSDIDRACRFYQRVFDMYMQTVQPMTSQAPVPILGLGAGPAFIAPYGGESVVGIGHACMGITNFRPQQVEKMLDALGVKHGDINRRRPAYPPYDVFEGFMLQDPDGTSVQIANNTYCAGRGPLGEDCP